ncbi:MAG TPA: MoxR family ATPase, partial [Spirochaetales bacterium]|nr:MoxR family ATPase [Spirochaetales bacterium]
QATLEGSTLPLPRPFMVVATQNPIEYEGTFPLPEAQLDRFMVRLSIGYPTADEERQILMRRAERRADEPELKAVCGLDGFAALSAAAEAVHVEEDLAAYAVALVRATRDAARVAVGASPRASLALLKLARAKAVMDGRMFALPDDIKWCAFEALAHRVTLRPDAWAADSRSDSVVRAAIASVPVPKAELV